MSEADAEWMRNLPFTFAIPAYRSIVVIFVSLYIESLVLPSAVHDICSNMHRQSFPELRRPRFFACQVHAGLLPGVPLGEQGLSDMYKVLQ